MVQRVKMDPVGEQETVLPVIVKVELQFAVLERVLMFNLDHP